MWNFKIILNRKGEKKNGKRNRQGNVKVLERNKRIIKEVGEGDENS